MVYVVSILVDDEDIEKYSDKDIEEIIDDALYKKKIDSRVRIIQRS
jgi:hypothetical protein